MKPPSMMATLTPLPVMPLAWSADARLAFTSSPETASSVPFSGSRTNPTEASRESAARDAGGISASTCEPSVIRILPPRLRTALAAALASRASTSTRTRPCCRLTPSSRASGERAQVPCGLRAS